jgi:NAD(P)-dependent dehydrogenase (short-subunit alcohol dehydrogenase family)
MEIKNIMITGANRGIGKETAIGIARLGARVIMVCRNPSRAVREQKEIQIKTNNPNVDILIGDLGSQESIKNLVTEFHAKYERLHVLINNAGVFLRKRSESVDGIETTFAVNHLAPFLLTKLLLPTLKDNKGIRIVNVSSGVHHRATIDFDDLQMIKRKYNGIAAYGQSKLANILFTYELNRRIQQKYPNMGATANVLHPGFVRTRLGSEGFIVHLFNLLIRPLITISPREGAKTSIFLAMNPEVAETTGKYFVKCKEVESSQESYNLESQRKLWTISEELTS